MIFDPEFSNLWFVYKKHFLTFCIQFLSRRAIGIEPAFCDSLNTRYSFQKFKVFNPSEVIRVHNLGVAEMAALHSNMRGKA